MTHTEPEATLRDLRTVSTALGQSSARLEEVDGGWELAVDWSASRHVIAHGATPRDAIARAAKAAMQKVIGDRGRLARELRERTEQHAALREIAGEVSE